MWFGNMNEKNLRYIWLFAICIFLYLNCEHAYGYVSNDFFIILVNYMYGLCGLVLYLSIFWKKCAKLLLYSLNFGFITYLTQLCPVTFLVPKLSLYCIFNPYLVYCYHILE